MRKLILLLLIVTCFPIQQIVFATTPEEASQEIIYTEKEQEIFGVLNALDIFTKDDGTINNLVTRGEFTEYALRFSGMSPLEIAQSESELRFPDIVNSDYRKAISLATEKGYVNGYDDGYFYPDNYITIYEASLMLGNVLGYGIAQGKISTYEIHKGVTPAEGSRVTQGVMAKLIFNALNCQTLELKLSDLEGYSFGETALYNFYEVETDIGVVQANDVTSLSSKDGCADDYVKIGENDYYDPQKIAWDMLGYKTFVYYKTNDLDEREIIYAMRQKNEILTVKADDILDETSELSFHYLRNDRHKNFSISPTLRVVNNYTLAIPYTLSMIHPDEGELTFIDNNNDGVYDVLISNTYEDYYVSGVDYQNGIVFDKYEKRNIETEEKECLIIKGGEFVDFSSIKVGDVISVYESDNYVLMDISSQIIEGSPTSIGETDNRRTVTINGTEYGMSTAFENALLSNKAGAIRLNSSVKLLLNNEGRIVASVVTDTGIQYGFLTRIYLSDDDEVYVKLVDSSGIKQNYMLYEKARVYVGNTTYSLHKTDKEFLIGEISRDQLVKYEIEKDVVKKLYVSDGYEVSDFTSDTENSLNLNENITSGYYNNISTMADNEWFCGVTTVIFGIPKDSDGSILYEDIKVYDSTKIVNGSYQMKVYDSDYNKIPGALVVFNANRNMEYKLYNSYKSFVLVTRKHLGINEDDEVATIIEGYYLGSPVTYSSTDPSIFADFEKGDMGQVALVDGKVYAARVLYKNKEVSSESYTDKKMTYLNTFHKRDVQNYGFVDDASIYTNKNSDYMLVHGTVLESNPNYISVQFASDPLDTNTVSNRGYTVLTYPIKSWTKIYKVSDEREPSLSQGNIGHLRNSSDFGSLNGSRVLLNVRAQRVDEIFIFE